MITRRTFLVAGIVFLLTVGIAVAWQMLPDPRLEQAQELQRRIADDATHALPVEEQVEMRKQLRAEARQLSPKQMAALWHERQRLTLARAERFLTLSKEEQTVALDAAIDRIEAIRQREAASRPSELGPAPSADERERILKLGLDASTPDERAKLGKYFKRYFDRRKERGMTPGGFPDGL